jgi:ABC-2 type transport system permease protein
MLKYIKAIWTETWFHTIELVRVPAYSLPTLALPTMLYLFFGLGYSRTEDMARYSLSSYAAFSVIAVALFQFGVGIAIERISPWERYVRTLPIHGGVRFISKLASAGLFAATTASLVIFAGVVFGHVTMPVDYWVKFIGALAIGGIVFSTMGMALGYWVKPKAAVPVANLLYLPLSFIGGLWIPPQFLPKVVSAISPWTPTRQYGELVWASTSGDPWQATSIAILTFFTVVLAIVAILGFRRVEAERFQ